jgi:hypothetical protein
VIEQKLKDKELEEDGVNKFVFARSILHEKIAWVVQIMFNNIAKQKEVCCSVKTVRN